MFCRIAGNFRELSKKTNFAKKTFANRPKKFYKEENFRGLVRQPLCTWPYQSMRVSTCVETHMHTRDLRTGNYRARLSCLQGALGTCLISLSAVVIVESDEDTV